MLQVPATHKINHVFNFLHLQSSSIVIINLYTWGALFLALLATFHVIKFRKNTPSSSISTSSFIDEDDFDDDETCSLSSASSEFEEEDDEEEEEQDENRAGEFFRLRGDDGNSDGGFLRSCRQSIGDIFSLSEIANNKNVVKLWDTIGFGLGFGFDDSDSYNDGRIVSVYGADEKQSVSPAGENSSENLALGIWDTRLRRRLPAMIAEWGPGNGNDAVGMESGGVQKVYVRDDGRYELTVGDKRSLLSPLGDLTESQLDLWWPNSCMIKI